MWKLHVLLQALLCIPALIVALSSLLVSRIAMQVFGLAFCMLDDEAIARLYRNLRIIEPYNHGPMLLLYFDDIVAGVAGMVHRRGLLEFTSSFALSEWSNSNPHMKHNPAHFNCCQQCSSSTHGSNIGSLAIYTAQNWERDSSLKLVMVKSWTPSRWDAGLRNTFREQRVQIQPGVTLRVHSSALTFSIRQIKDSLLLAWSTRRYQPSCIQLTSKPHKRYHCRVQRVFLQQQSFQSIAWYAN